MTAPDITFDVRTASPAGLLYARLGSTAQVALPSAQVSFVLDVTNHSTDPVTLDKLRVGFPGEPIVPHVVSIKWNDGTDVVVGPGETTTWWNQPADNLFLTMPPAEVELFVTADGFDDAVTVTLPLVAHESGPNGAGYRFPGRRGDLEKNEYWYGRAGSHGAAGGGNQLFAYDLVGIGWNADAAKWSRLREGTDGTQNDHYRLYGKPVYAMADGVVVEFGDGMAENVPGQKTTPVEGNHLYVQHGDELALYAHFQPGSIDPALLVQGAAVEAGQQLGLVGNSGNSSEPHLHIHLIEGTAPWQGPPRPLHFRRFDAQDRDALGPAPDDTGWVTVTNCALPREKTAIRPSVRVGTIPEDQPDFEFSRKPKFTGEVLVGETTPGVDKGAPGFVRLPGGGRKPIGPR